MGTYLSRLASANAGGIYLTRQGKSREGEDLNLGEDSPIIFQGNYFFQVIRDMFGNTSRCARVCLDIMQVSDMNTKIYLEIHLYVCEGVWTLCKNLVDQDLHASTTSEHTVGTLCPYMQTDEIPSLRN